MTLQGARGLFPFALSLLLFILQCGEGPVDADGDGYTAEGGDCDDTDPSVNPAATEICGDGIDSDCDKDPDNGSMDLDKDGFIDDRCTGGDDCNDLDPGVRPGIEDGCDGIDSDCDLQVDEDVTMIDRGGGGDLLSIQEAIDIAGKDEILCVKEGIYHENLTFSGERVRVIGQKGPFYTVVDGGGAGSVASFTMGNDSRIQGLTLKNGTGTPADPDGDGEFLLYGGCIYSQYASPAIEDLIVTGCSADDGGGIFLSRSGATIKNTIIAFNSASRYGGGVRFRHQTVTDFTGNTVYGNTATSGGGVSVYSTPLNIYDSTFSGNQAEDFGGGLQVTTGSWVTVSGSLFEGNSARSGGGVSLYSAHLEMHGTSFSGNTALSKGGGAYSGTGGVMLVREARFEENQAGDVGGGLRLYSSKASLEWSDLIGNIAGEMGGGIGCKGSRLYILYTQFEENSPDDASYDGCRGY